MIVSRHDYNCEGMTRGELEKILNSHLSQREVHTRVRERIMRDSQIIVPRDVYSCSDLFRIGKQDSTRTFLNMHFPLVPHATGGSGVPQSVLGWRPDSEEGLGDAGESMAGERDDFLVGCLFRCGVGYAKTEMPASS